MKMNKTSKIIFVAAIILVGFMHCGAFAQSTQTQGDPANLLTSSNQYVGTFYAQAKMTNSHGIFWITPPTNTQTGTFTDASGFPAPYVSAITVARRSDGYMWHTNNNNSVTFPATNSSYSLSVYVTGLPPPPTNGQTLTLQVQWNTNSP